MIAHFDKKGKKKKKDMKKNINELKPHPRNQEFFDDIEGEKWDEFLESISHGVIEPLIITQDNVIVSGHQRVRALKEIGKRETVNCIVKEYEDEDAVLLDLIESNIQQRGQVGGSAQKVGRRIKERERIYGVKSGLQKNGDSPRKTQSELASEMGIDLTTYRKYRNLADMIPELADAVDAGTIGTEAALAVVKRLSEDEQLELLSRMDTAKRYTEKETADLIAEIQDLKNRPAEVVEKIPDDYDDLQYDLEKANSTIAGMKSDYDILSEDLEERTLERDELRDKLESYEEADSGNARKKHQIDTGIMFNTRVTKFIEDVAGYVWLTDEILELPDVDRELFIRTVEKVRQWAEQMEYNINQKLKEK